MESLLVLRTQDTVLELGAWPTLETVPKQEAPPVVSCVVLSRAVRVIRISKDLILHGGSGVACGGSFNLERGGKEKKEVKVPTTATLTKPLLPGLPSGRSRGHSPTSKQARTRVWSNSRPTCRRGGGGQSACHRGGQNACRRGGQNACRREGQSVPTAEEDRTPAAGEDRVPAAAEK